MNFWHNRKIYSWTGTGTSSSQTLDLQTSSTAHPATSCQPHVVPLVMPHQSWSLAMDSMSVAVLISGAVVSSWYVFIHVVLFANPSVRMFMGDGNKGLKEQGLTMSILHKS